MFRIRWQSVNNNDQHLHHEHLTKMLSEMRATLT
jgi:hypothetical protein